MAIIVETGAIVDGANSFDTVANFDIWLADYGRAVTGDKEVLLKQSYSYMSVLNWCKSHKVAFTVENEHKLAQFEIAYSIENGFDPFSVVSDRVLKRKKIDVLEKEWESGDNGNSPSAKLSLVPMANALLNGLICGSGANNFELIR